jgi:hypothetical protein
VTRIQVLEWTLECDPARTRAAYEGMGPGSPEACACDECRNFIAARHLAYPPEAMSLFAALGIRADAEAEVHRGGEASSGRLAYCGWFHFAGAMLSGPSFRVTEQHGVGEGIVGAFRVSRLEYRPLAGTFDIGFSSVAHLAPKPWHDEVLLQLEFQTTVPWLLATPPPASTGHH